MSSNIRVSALNSYLLFPFDGFISALAELNDLFGKKFVETYVIGTLNAAIENESFFHFFNNLFRDCISR